MRLQPESMSESGSSRSLTKRPESPLVGLRVASPCTASWIEMQCDNRVHFCDKCHLNAYDLSGLSSSEVGNLLLAKEGRHCVRVFSAF